MAHLDRLKKLLSVFESAKEVPHGYVLDLGEDVVLFDIGDWTHPVVRGIDLCDVELTRSTLEKIDAANLSTYCGTACCVAGTAPLIPEFRRAGLKLVGGMPAMGGDNVFEGQIFGHLAFAKFFEIRNGEAADICYPSSYEGMPGVLFCEGNIMDSSITPLHVCTKLRELIARYEQADSL